jgi:iron complex transport system substrate-binding protein
VCAIGAEDCLVGRTTVCDYPPEVVARVPVVGDFGVPHLEALMKVKPTIILEVDMADSSLRHKLDSLGFVRHRIECKTLTDIPSAIRKIGELLERKDSANQLAERFETRLKELRENVKTQRKPRVFLELCNDPLVTAGRNSFLNELVELAGGSNIASEVSSDYFKIASEWVISKNPDVIICLSMPAGKGAKKFVLGRPGWNVIEAVKKGRVYDDLDVNVVTRPGPRVLDAVEEIRRRIFAGDEKQLTDVKQ